MTDPDPERRGLGDLCTQGSPDGAQMSSHWAHPDLMLYDTTFMVSTVLSVRSMNFFRGIIETAWVVGTPGFGQKCQWSPRL